jgi:hypothetical protein
MCCISRRQRVSPEGLGWLGNITGRTAGGLGGAESRGVQMCQCGEACMIVAFESAADPLQSAV